MEIPTRGAKLPQLTLPGVNALLILGSISQLARGCHQPRVERGERFHAPTSRRKGRVNMIAALCNQKLSAPFTIEGGCNRTVFEMWL
jgi:hypothetical protein